MTGEPVVREIVDDEGGDGEHKRGEETLLRLGIEQGVAKAEAPGDATLPP